MSLNSRLESSKKRRKHQTGSVFSLQCPGFSDQGSGSRVQGSGSRVQGQRSSIQSSVFGVQGVQGAEGSRFWVRISGFGVWGVEF